MTFVKTLVTFVAVILSFMMGASQAGPVTIYKTPLPNIKFKRVVESPISGKKIDLDSFKDLASGWFAGDVELNTARLCKVDRFSTANIVPYQYLLIYSIRKGGDTYYTEVDLADKLSKEFMSSLDRREDPFCEVWSKLHTVNVKYIYTEPKVAAQ